MKKSFRAVVAFLTAMTMTAGALGVTAYAAEETQSAVTKAVQTTAATTAKTTAATTITTAETTAPVSSDRTVEGTFKGGAAYCYVKSSGALIIDGEGTFTTSEFDKLTAKLAPTIVLFCKDVKLPSSKSAANEWLASKICFTSDFTVLTYDDSDADTKRSEMLNVLKAEVVKEGKDMNRSASTLADMFPMECFEHTFRDPRSYFDYTDAVVAKGKELNAYFVENGVSERVAKKVTAMYLLGLTHRINSFNAFPDGRERNEETTEVYLEDWLKSAQGEDVLLSQLTDEGLTLANAVSYLTDKGLFLTKKHNYERLCDVGGRLSDAFTWICYGTRPQELIDAEEKDYYDNFVAPYVAPDLSNIDEILEYRGKWMRDYLENDDRPYEPEAVDETVDLYLQGLRIRLEEGLAKENGEEINDDTKYEYYNMCRSYVMYKDYLVKDEKGILVEGERTKQVEKEIEGYKSTCEEKKKLIVSDLTVHTEDRDTKFINRYGEYVKYAEFAENEGTLESGIKYHYYPKTGGLLLDGDGALTYDDYENIYHNFDINFYVMGKNVQYDSSLMHQRTGEKYIFNHWIFRYTRRGSQTYLYTFEDSVTKRDLDTIIDLFFNDQENYYSSLFEYPITDRSVVENAFNIGILKDEKEMEELLTGVKKAVPEGAVASLKGDADESGDVGLSDVIAVSKFNLNNKLYPLKSDTAKANADMNGDCIIDSRDTSALIELNLS